MARDVKPILYQVKNGTWLNLRMMESLEVRLERKNPKALAEMKLPRLVLTMASGTEWLVAEGDSVNEERQLILTLCGYEI